MESMHDRNLLVKIDFQNAFNTVRRDAILEAVAKHLPEFLPFACSSMAYPSELQFGKFMLVSEEGAQQGDPLGPLYFCLVVKELLDLLQSELVIGYLDNLTLGDDAEICLQVVQDFQMLEVSAARLGLQP